MERSKKENIIVIIICIILLLITLFLIKIFLIDKWIEKQKKEKIIKLIDKYFEEKEYGVARKFTEELLLKYDDEELIELLDKILKAEKENAKDNDIIVYNPDQSKLDRIISLLYAILNKKEKVQKPVVIEKIYKGTREGIEEEIIIDEFEVQKLLKEGIEAFNNKDYALAKEIFQRVLKLSPKNALGNAYLGATLFEENPENDKNIKNASEFCSISIEEDNAIEISHFTLARIYEGKQLYESAIKEYNETLRINPNSYYSYYGIGKIYYNKKDYNGARKYFINSVEAKDDFIDGYLYLADTELILNNLSSAKKSLEVAVGLQPNLYHCYIKLAEISSTESDYITAINYYKKALKYHNNYVYFIRIAYFYESLNQFDNAFKNYNYSISQNPMQSEKEKRDAIETYKNIIVIKKRENKDKEALKILEKGIIKLNNYASPLYYYTAEIKREQGDYKDAIDDYFKSIELNQEEKDNYENYYKIGLCYQSLGKNNKAIESYKNGIKSNPDFLDSYYSLGKLYYDNKKYNDAESLFKIILEKSPRNKWEQEINNMLYQIENNKFKGSP